jgi:hypothetical protein
MSVYTQIKAEQKQCAAKMKTAQKRLAKTEAEIRAISTRLQAQRDVVKGLEGVQHKLDQQLKLEEGGKPTEKTRTGSAKPGPKPKVHAAGVKTGKKPGPKPKAAKASKAKGGAKASTRAAEGRRQVAQKLRPPIKDVIAKVLGKRVMNSQEVYEAIKEKGQLPNSNDPRGYIGYLLSASKDKAGNPLFERVATKGRGFYKNQGTEVSAKATKAVKAKPVKAAKAAKAVKVKAAPAKKAAKAKAAPKAKAAAKGEKRQNKCGKCAALGNEVYGHNSKGHDTWAAAQKAGPAPAKAAKPAKAPKPAKEPKAAKAAPAPGEKKSVKCGKCAALGKEVFGHNAKGHDNWIAKQTPTAKPANGTTGAATPAEPEKAAPKAEAPKAEAKPAEKTTDEILAEAGVDLSSSAAAPL